MEILLAPVYKDTRGYSLKHNDSDSLNFINTGVGKSRFAVHMEKNIIIIIIQEKTFTHSQHKPTFAPPCISISI